MAKKEKKEQPVLSLDGKEYVIEDMTDEEKQMINHINENKNKHIITIEDPVEYYHNSIESLINQRELGHSTNSFSNA